MNIFRFIADMLHLSAILILLYRIKKNRNCIGKQHLLDKEKMHLDKDINNTCFYRSVVEDIGIVFTRILHEILRPLHVLHLPLQHTHEDLLHLLNRICYLLDEI